MIFCRRQQLTVFESFFDPVRPRNAAAVCAVRSARAYVFFFTRTRSRRRSRYRDVRVFTDRLRRERFRRCYCYYYYYYYHRRRRCYIIRPIETTTSSCAFKYFFNRVSLVGATSDRSTPRFRFSSDTKRKKRSTRLCDTRSIPGSREPWSFYFLFSSLSVVHIQTRFIIGKRPHCCRSITRRPSTYEATTFYRYIILSCRKQKTVRGRVYCACI